MQVSRFSPRISLIEMAPRAAPHRGCPGRLALPYPYPCPVCHQLHRERAVTGRIFQPLPTQTDTTVALYIRPPRRLVRAVSRSSGRVSAWPPCPALPYPCLALFVTTDRHHCCFNIYDNMYKSFSCFCVWIKSMNMIVVTK